MRKLLDRWQSLSRQPKPSVKIEVAIETRDAARLHALADMYPGLSSEEILSDLIRSSLDNLQETFPYVNGERQLAEDEFGNPIYEDIGPTPTFLALTQKHLSKLQSAQNTPEIA